MLLYKVHAPISLLGEDISPANPIHLDAPKLLYANASVRDVPWSKNHWLFPLPLRQSLNASSHSLQSSPHLSLTKPQLLARMIFSTPLSCLITAASLSVLGSLGKNLAEYGSSLSSTILSLSLWLSTSLNTDSGSSGSGLVATDAQ